MRRYGLFETLDREYLYPSVAAAVTAINQRRVP
jgi:hypothetical protein